MAEGRWEISYSTAERLTSSIPKQVCCSFEGVKSCPNKPVAIGLRRNALLGQVMIPTSAVPQIVQHGRNGTPERRLQTLSSVGRILNRDGFQDGVLEQLKAVQNTLLLNSTIVKGRRFTSRYRIPEDICGSKKHQEKSVIRAVVVEDCSLDDPRGLSIILKVSGIPADLFLICVVRLVRLHWNQIILEIKEWAELGAYLNKESQLWLAKRKPPFRRKAVNFRFPIKDYR